jgi:hypothetical protein
VWRALEANETMKGLTKTQENKISKKIDWFYGEIIDKYDESKYDEEEYARLKRVFSDPFDVDYYDLKHALMWKYGKSTEKSFNKNKSHLGTVRTLNNNWKAFASQKLRAGESQFNFLMSKAKSTQYISIAFICHLLSPGKVPIIDQHNYRALRYFLMDSGYKKTMKGSASNWEDIVLLKDFINRFTRGKNRSKRDFDKYLMMFGKHVAPR